MHIHILGICGTFMGSLALLARELGHKVTGSDQNVYPPMSTQLENAGIEIMQGYAADHLKPKNGNPAPDLVVVGNAMKRGIEAVEYMLDNGLRYTSGPQFLSEQVLQNRHVLAIAGTHGKTTTTTMLAWILQSNHINTGYLIGGVPQIGEHGGFELSANLGETYFVIEADEYDSAFFDKRSKFVHYRPKTAVLNNLEFDHADIFDDLAAIQKQFHHMVRMIPSSGQIIMPANTQSLEDTINLGVWTPVQRTSIADTESFQTAADWQTKLINKDGSKFSVSFNGETATVAWGMSGLHNVQNGMAAIAAANHIGISVENACAALSKFAGIKRRMELIGEEKGIKVYDDFAHHPTAIATTLDGARKRFGNQKIWAVIEPRSNTMRMGSHQDNLAPSASLADEVIWYQPKGMDWQLADAIGNAAAKTNNNQSVMNDTADIIHRLKTEASEGDVIIIMSNGSFDGIYKKLLAALVG